MIMSHDVVLLTLWKLRDRIEPDPGTIDCVAIYIANKYIYIVPPGSVWFDSISQLLKSQYILIVPKQNIAISINCLDLVQYNIAIYLDCGRSNEMLLQYIIY
jgi:hypothetical protein